MSDLAGKLIRFPRGGVATLLQEAPENGATPKLTEAEAVALGIIAQACCAAAVRTIPAKVIESLEAKGMIETRMLDVKGGEA